MMHRGYSSRMTRLFCSIDEPLQSCSRWRSCGSQVKLVHPEPERYEFEGCGSASQRSNSLTLEMDQGFDQVNEFSSNDQPGRPGRRTCVGSGLGTAS